MSKEVSIQIFRPLSHKIPVKQNKVSQNIHSKSLKKLIGSHLSYGNAYNFGNYQLFGRHSYIADVSVRI